jgi:hypothetical protein
MASDIDLDKLEGEWRAGADLAPIARHVILALITALRQAHAERDAARGEGAAEALEGVAEEFAARAKSDSMHPGGDYGLGFEAAYAGAWSHCRTQAAALREGSKKP